MERPKLDLKTTDAKVENLLIDLRNGVYSVAQTTPPWWRRLYERAINHKGTSLFLAVALCAVSVIGGGYFKYWLDHRNDGWNTAVDGRIDAVLSAKGGVSTQLNTMATDLPAPPLRRFLFTG